MSQAKMASESSGSTAMNPSPAVSTAPSTVSVESSTPPKEDYAVEKQPDDSSKLKLFLGILRKFVGVADIASVRFSLPSQLLEPRPNLEYWTYLDRPETFAAIGDSDEPVERMLEVLRFWFTKDLKYVKGKPCKPYNSTLGEFFRCNWEVEERAPPISSLTTTATTGSGKSSIKSEKSSKSTLASSRTSSAQVVPQASSSGGKRIRISYLTEQTSHHPPVSAFFVSCPEKGITAQGFDQISAKFTGTSIRVTAGEHNLGIFITLKNRDNEQYQLTHPAAHLGGLLRGSLSVTVGDQCFISCAKTRLKTILNYVEEGWLGKAQNKVEGTVFRYDPDNDNIWKLKDVPEKDIVARVGGCWKERINFSLGPKPMPPKEQTVLIDLNPLQISSKNLPPMNQQLPNESLRLWDGVTQAIQNKQFSRATTVKQELEEAQREKARLREQKNVEWTPRFFKGITTPKGKPELTEEGEEELRKLSEGQWELSERSDGVI